MVMRPAVKRTSGWGVLSVAGVTLAIAWPVAAQDGAEEHGHADQDGDHDGGHGPSRCSEVEFSVSLADDSPDTYRVVGELCVPRGRRADTLQILIHGSTYNRSYWDFPFQSHRYSYVRHANQAGFATLAIDRLGSGESDHPAPEIISVHGTAHTVHQIVSAVRSGSHHAADGRRLDFDRIVLVGHSFGSNISWTEAGIYGDVDGLILTAISHDMNPPAAPLTQTLSYPAAFDPAFAGAGFPLGYLTTIPGARAELFYHVPGADPDVIAVDEATKDVIPVGVLFDQFTTYGLTQNIHVPVLNVVGNFDTLACQLPSCDGSGSIANEGSNYPADADYTQLIVPEAGHSVNLHRNAPAWYRQAQAWVHDHVEPHGHGH